MIKIKMHSSAEEMVDVIVPMVWHPKQKFLLLTPHRTCFPFKADMGHFYAMKGQSEASKGV